MTAVLGRLRAPQGVSVRLLAVTTSASGVDGRRTTTTTQSWQGLARWQPVALEDQAQQGRTLGRDRRQFRLPGGVVVNASDRLDAFGFTWEVYAVEHRLSRTIVYAERAT